MVKMVSVSLKDSLDGWTLEDGTLGNTVLTAAMEIGKGL